MKRTTGLKRSPFGQTSVRFNPEPHVKKTPGIIFHSLAIKLEYKKIDVPEMLMENLRKQIFFSRIYIVEIECVWFDGMKYLYFNKFHFFVK